MEENGIDFTAHIVGFGLQEREGAQIACLAEETGGRYLDAASAAELTAALTETLAAPAPKESATSLHSAALHSAARNGDVEAIGALLAAGADPGAQAKDGLTPLHVAAQEGQAAAIAALLDGGADPGARAYEYGLTPLHAAASEGHAAAIAALLAAGADPGAREDEYGHTPLHEAARYGHAAAIAALLDGGADAGAKDKDGDTPFDLISDDSSLVGTPAYRRLNIDKSRPAGSGPSGPGR